MTHPHANPFEDGPAKAPGKTIFGTLRVFTRKVNTKTGAFYVVNDLGIDPDNPDSHLNRITDTNGNLKEFRGKQLTPSGSSTHVLPVITTKNKDGMLYNTCRDFLLWDTSKVQRVTYPSLQQFFGGPKLPGIYGEGKSAEVEAKIVSIPNDPYSPKQAFKIVKVFKDQTEREAAETAFFSQFQQSGAEIANDIPGFEDDPMPWDDGDKPVGMTKEQAATLLPTLYAASGQDKDKFLAQLNGMPVVLTALGGIDAPEIVAIYS